MNRAIFIGDIFKTNCHGEIEVIDYNNANDITVKFLNSGNIRKASSGNIQKGKVKDLGVPPIKNGKRKSDYENIKVGGIYKNSEGLEFEIESYVSSSTVHIKFLATGYTTIVSAQNIRKGHIRDYLAPSTRSVGILGVGNYDSKTHSLAFGHWVSMITRCYDDAYIEKFKTYEDKTVCDEWLNFQNFAKWFYDQPNHDKGWSLDKDILIKGNKVYSPDSCTFVPQHINQIVVTNKRRRGKYPIGVYWCNTKKRFGACLNKNGGTKTLSYSNTPEEAFLKYKKAKEAHIKDVILEYKDVFPSKLYDALYNYQVEITD